MKPFQVKIRCDVDGKKLIIEDTGVGMSKETEAQDWLRVRVALSTYMRNQLPNGLRFEDECDFKQCVMDAIEGIADDLARIADDLAQEVSPREYEYIIPADAVGREVITLSGDVRSVVGYEYLGLRAGAVFTFDDGSTEACHGVRVPAVKA